MNLIRTRQTRSLPVSTDSFEPFRIMRNLLRWDPYQENNFLGEAGNAFMPSFDVKETSDAYVFAADMPGIHTGDLDVQLTGNRLTISGHREAEESKDGERSYTQERSFGAFSRTFALPEEVESNKVVADLRDGVFHLMVPKSPEIRPQKIAVSYKN